jgi:lipopolysaccharide export system permease protein
MEVFPANSEALLRCALPQYLYSIPVILARYILREHVAPFFYSLFVITFLFLIDFLIRILSSILSKGLDWRVVTEIVVLNLAWMLALSIPMAVLVAALMAFGRLSADNETTALRALGISPVRAMMPVLLVAALLAGGLMWFNDRVLPEANYRAASLRNDIGRKKPAAFIAPRRVIRDFEGYRLWMDRVDPRTDVFYGVRVYQQERGQPVRYTFADSATLGYSPDGAYLLIHLYHGENHVIEPRDPKQYVRVRFREQTAAIRNVDANLNRQERGYRTDREMSVEQMMRIVTDNRKMLVTLREEYAPRLFEDVRAIDIRFLADSSRPVPPRLLREDWATQSAGIGITPTVIATARKQEEDKLRLLERYESRSRSARMEINQYLVEVHKKYSIPVAALVFVLVGAPLGIMARRGGLGTGVVYSLAFFILYWAGMIRGEALSDQLDMSPVAAMWGPNIVVGAGGLWLLWRVVRERYAPGMPAWKRLVSFIGRIRPRRKKRQDGEARTP